MASSLSSSATTFPTASTKKMRVRSKSTSAVEDTQEETSLTDEKKAVDGVKTTFHVNGMNDTRNGQESLFVKTPKDKHHDRKSRSGRRGLPKKGEFGFEVNANIYSSRI